MSTIKLKKGYNLKLKGGIHQLEVSGKAATSNCFAIIPDDFVGIIPRLDKKLGETVKAGEPLYHDKNFERVKVVSPVSGSIKDVCRGNRRKIEAIIIEPDGKSSH